MIGSGLRAAAASAVSTEGRSEESTYPAICAALSELVPAGFEARVLTPGGTEHGFPDIQVVARRTGARVAHVEVKLPQTVDQVFAPGPGGAPSQASRYRADGIPVWLTDALEWWDITTHDDRSHVIASFRDADAAADAAAAEQLRSAAHIVCRVRPRFSRSTAVSAISGVIDRIDSADDRPLASGWKIVRDELGLMFDADHLDASGPGEIVTFTLLATACDLRQLPDRTFVDEAAAEWVSELPRRDVEELPAALGSTLRLFRDEDRVHGGTLLGADGWVTIRAIAAWIGAARDRDDRWGRLSDLWDMYLHTTGRRKGLGSWQTHHSIAAYQAELVSNALKNLGYSGVADPRVTIFDPCCGTGVYLQAVVEQGIAEGASAGAFNASHDGDQPRLVGNDISSTAVAAAHIRLRPTGARPTFYMTDTLAAGVGPSVQPIFRLTGAAGANEIVAAARTDAEEFNRWACRDGGRDPILAVVGNPPYLRNGLRNERYQEFGWSNELVKSWRRGSGGRGVVDDLYIGFWAWAFEVMRQPNPQVSAPPFGVVSFISNRAWTKTRTFGPMRRWLAGQACRIRIADFGPSSRRGASQRWSDQPFEIETGVAIATIEFSLAIEGKPPIMYQRAQWIDEQVVLGDETLIEREAWVSGEPFASLTQGVTSFPGVVTSDDARWLRTAADRQHPTRYAYRAFDNRWAPHAPPPRAPRTRDPLPHEARASAYWRDENLWSPTSVHRHGGWYAILPSEASAPAPGPAIHATRHVPDMHLHCGDGGSVVPVSKGCTIPAGLVAGSPRYLEWVGQHRLTGEDFWFYMLAAGDHSGYWTPGHPLASQFEDVSIEPPLTDQRTSISRMVELGRELLELWSLDAVDPVPHERMRDGWEFECEAAALQIRVHNRRVLQTWRGARDGTWDHHTAEEYARCIASLLRTREIADEVARLVPVE